MNLTRMTHETDFKTSATVSRGTFWSVGFIEILISLSDLDFVGLNMNGNILKK